MDEQQLRKALRDIADKAVPAELDLWPGLQTKLRRRPQPQWWAAGRKTVWRLTGAGVALAAVALFAVWLASLSQMATTPAASMTSPTAPTTLVAPATTPLPPQYQVSTAAALAYPEAPATLPRYQVEVIPLPDTAEGVLAWANDFGLPDAKLFRDPKNPESLIALGSNGEQLSFPLSPVTFYSAMERLAGVFTHPPPAPPTDFYLTPSYRGAEWSELAEGETISFADGTAAAVTFLERHHQLPDHYPYHVRDLPSHTFSAGGYPLRLIHVSPDLEGYPLVGPSNNRLGATLFIDAAGAIIWAAFGEAAFTPAEPVPLRPAQEVVTDFVDGRLHPLAFDAVPTTGSWRDVAQYNPPLPDHTISERITVLETDDTHFLVAEDGSEVRATLRTGVGAKYELLTPDLGQIAATIENDELQVTGTIVAQTAADTWQLEVETWEILRQQDLISGCVVGPVEIAAGGTAWITAGETLGQVPQNGRYRISNLPEAINNGDPIEVCLESTLALGEELKWTTIYVPPRALGEYGRSQPDSQPGGTELVIGHLELAYYFDPAGERDVAEPVWMVEGYSQDETTRFVATLPATAESVVTITTIEVPEGVITIREEEFGPPVTPDPAQVDGTTSSDDRLREDMLREIQQMQATVEKMRSESEGLEQEAEE